MAAGLIAGAIQGLGGAMQQNAQGQIEEQRQRALARLEQEMGFERDDRQWERKKAMTAEERKLEERRRQEDREWDVADAEADRAHRTRLAQMRAASSGGAGGRVPSRITEAQILMEQDPEKWPTFSDAYDTVRSRAGQNTDYGQAADQVNYLTQQIDSIDNVLNDEDVRFMYDESEVAELQERREMLFQNLKGLEQEAYGIGEPAEAPEPAPRGEGTPPPLLSRPGSSGNGSNGAGTPPPQRERGQRPGPAAEDPGASADDILKEFGL